MILGVSSGPDNRTVCHQHQHPVTYCMSVSCVSPCLHGTSWSVWRRKSERPKHDSNQIFSVCYNIDGCWWVRDSPVDGGVSIIGARLVTSPTLETWSWSAISQLCSRPAATSLLWRWSRISQGERFIVSSRSRPRLIFDNSLVWGVRKA